MSGLAAAATPRQITRADRAGAASVAERLLADVVLAPETDAVPREPPGSEHQLDRPVVLMFFAAQIDRPGFWVTKASPSAVIASFESHLPRTVRSLGSGFGGSLVFAAYQWA